MEFFRSAKVVRLRSLHKYLVARIHHEDVALVDVNARDKDDAFTESNYLANRHGYFADRGDRHGYRDDRDTQWSVEFVPNSDSVIRLQSYYGGYLTASDQLSRFGMTGCEVLLSLPLPLDSSLELKPVMEGTHFKLRTHYGTFLCANSSDPGKPESITHDLPHHTTILWDVEVLERKEEASASNSDDKALEQGSATKRRHETGGGSSVTKSPPGDSRLIRKSDRVIYRRHFWELKNLLLDDSERNDVLVKGGSGTAALVRELCADIRQHFGTIAWISIPRSEDFVLICEELFVQLICERAAFYSNKNPWMLEDHELSLQQKEGCLIVVDNLDNPKTQAKFEQILSIVKTCRVIFIDRSKVGSSERQINQYGRKFKPYELEDLSYVPREKLLMDFLQKSFPASSKGVGRLIVEECDKLPSAIIFVLCKERKQAYSSAEIKDQWEARMPSVSPGHKLLVIQQLLMALYYDLHGLKNDKLDPIPQMMKILRKGGDHLRRFLYLSIFPENSLISCKRVSCLWAAEGFLLRRDAEHPFDDSLWRKCIQPEEKRTDGKLSTFKVDDRVLQIIVLLFDLRARVTITSQGSTNWPETVRYLHVQTTVEEERLFPRSSIFVLDVSSNEDKTTSETSPLETSETLFPFASKLEHSRVLDLKGAPLQIVYAALDLLSKKTDPRLRYLSLSNTSIKVIPDSIGMLKLLEFLVLKHSLVTELPPEVGRLKKIRHILIYHHEKDPLMESHNLIGFKASCKVGRFPCLEKLCFVEANKRMLKDLGKLTQLRRLGITKLRATHGKLLSCSLEKLEKLESLNVHAFEEDEIIDLSDLSSPPKHLERLYLHGRLEKLPDWISSLNDLTRIRLRWGQLEEDPLATLGQMPKLVELELCRAYEGRQLDFKNKQFPELKILVLDKLEGLRSMSLEKGTTPCLENLTISRCQWLERIPSGIKDISTIQRLEFFDMSSEFYEMVRKDHEKDRYQCFENIPEVRFRQWRAGHWETHQVESADEASCLP